MESQSTYSHTTPSTYLILEWLANEKTRKYLMCCKVLVLLQNTTYELLNQFREHLEKTYEIYFRLIIEEECRMAWDDHLCIKPVNSSFCRQEVKTVCEKDCNLVVVGFRSEATARDIKDLTDIARQARYILLFYPISIRIGKELSEKRVPVSCGWFLNDADSEALRRQAIFYINNYLLKMPLFLGWYKAKTKILAHYGLNCEVENHPLLYCVANFGSDRYMNFQRYLSNEYVKKAYGRMDALTIVGFAVTPNAVFARVALEPKQKLLWRIPESLRFYSNLLTSGGTLNDICPPESMTLSTSQRKSTATLKIDPRPFNRKYFAKNKGRTAHFVLGRVYGSDPTRNMVEVTRVASRELFSFKVGQESHGWRNVGPAAIKSLGKYWIIYPKRPYIVESVFTSCCFG